MRKLIALSLMVVCLAGFSLGCGGGETKPAPAPAPTGGEAGETAPEGGEAAAPETTE